MSSHAWLHRDDFAPRVLVCGDLMLDVYYSGDVSRVSPEAPIPVLHRREVRRVPGGAANVAVNLAALGARVTVCGVVGDDPEGRALVALLEKHGVERLLVTTVADRPTTTKIRLVTGRQQIARTDIEEASDLPEPVARRLVATCESVFAGDDRVDAVILSDYGKGVLAAPTVAALIARARRAGVVSVADPKSRDMTRYRGVGALVPNRKEAAAGTGLPVLSRADLERAGAAILQQTDAEIVIITLGEEGAYFTTPTGQNGVVMSAAREVYDVTGAGDTLMSALVLGRLATGSWQEAVRVANAAAGVVVGKFGTAIVTRDELSRALDPVPDLWSKVRAGDDLVRAVEEHRASGRRIVFTNGCFDVLHAGHVSLLTTARAYGDVLVVGLNSDASVRRNKGPGRPVNPEGHRASVMAALECVSIVTLFDEDSPLRLIERIRPHVLVKGGDYTLDQICGRHLVEGYGGDVRIVPLVHGLSTTALIERLAAQRASARPDRLPRASSRRIGLSGPGRTSR